MDKIEENVEKRKYVHYEFKDIYDYLVSKKYPDGITCKGEKANYRRACRNFQVIDNELQFMRRQKDGSVKQVYSKFMQQVDSDVL